MVRVIFIFLLVSIAYSSKAQERVISPAATLEKTEPVKSAALSFAESEFNFGKIPQGKPVTHIFKFKNTGSEPMVLNEVHASCGCTTPEWSRDTIPAGGSSSIRVGFNAASVGEFVKPIFITYNGDKSQQILIKGYVWQTPDESAPVNQLVNQLNKK